MTSKCHWCYRKGRMTTAVLWMKWRCFLLPAVPARENLWWRRTSLLWQDPAGFVPTPQKCLVAKATTAPSAPYGGGGRAGCRSVDVYRSSSSKNARLVYGFNIIYLPIPCNKSMTRKNALVIFVSTLAFFKHRPRYFRNIFQKNIFQPLPIHYFTGI